MIAFTNGIIIIIRVCGLITRHVNHLNARSVVVALIIVTALFIRALTFIPIVVPVIHTIAHFIFAAQGLLFVDVSDDGCSSEQLIGGVGFGDENGSDSAEQADVVPDGWVHELQEGDEAPIEGNEDEPDVSEVVVFCAFDFEAHPEDDLEGYRQEADDEVPDQQ